MFWLEAAGVARQEGAMKISCQHFAAGGCSSGKKCDLTALLVRVGKYFGLIKKSVYLFLFSVTC